MPRKPTSPSPTDADIMRHTNVPAEVAARYIGWSSSTIYRALQEERAPFGFAVQQSKGSWSYNISPGLLTKYKRGELPTYRLEAVQSLAVEGIERIISEKLGGLQQLLNKAVSL